MNNRKLKIIAIGGTTTVQKNMYIYETDDDILVVDVGIGFPTIDEPGVDIVIPDFSYIIKNKHKVRGILITHGHEDHRGAIPYLLKEYKFKIYAVRFVKKLIERTLGEYKDLKDYKINEFDPNKPFFIGGFRINAFTVNHSIPDCYGFAIDTPAGRVFHNADYKFDWTPVMGNPFDVKKAATLAMEKGEPIALLSDCLGATSEGYSVTEQSIQNTFEDIINEAKGKQVFITTISSNISRISQAIEASRMYGRKIVLVGRSLNNAYEVAKEMRYVDYDKSIFVNQSKAKNEDQSKLTYIISGCYGQTNSGLSKVAYNEHREIKMQKDAVVVFSADPIPSAIATVNTLINTLYDFGAEVYYTEIQDNLHVSGHGSRGDLMLLANIIKPKYYIPIGGNIKHMKAYSNMIHSMGVERANIIELLDGESVVFESSKAKKGEKLKLKDVYVSGNMVGDIGSIVLDDRARISTDGIFVIILTDKDVDVITRGFVFVKNSKDLIEDSKVLARKIIAENIGDKDTVKIKQKLEQRMGDYLFTKTGRRPMIVVRKV